MMVSRIVLVSLAAILPMACAAPDPRQSELADAPPIEPGDSSPLPPRIFALTTPKPPGGAIALHTPSGAADVVFKWRDNFSPAMAVGRPIDSRVYLICIVDADQDCDWAARERRNGIPSNRMGGGPTPHAIWTVPHFHSQLDTETNAGITHFTFSDDGPDRKCLPTNLAPASYPGRFFVALGFCLERPPYDGTGGWDCVQAENRYSVIFSSPLETRGTPRCLVKSP